MALSHGSHHTLRDLGDWDWKQSVRHLIDQAPSTEEIRRLASPSAWRGHSGPNGLAMAGIFAAGLIAGAGLALLFAPKPGQELRSQLRRQVGFEGPEDEFGGRVSGDGPHVSTSSIPPR